MRRSNGSRELRRIVVFSLIAIAVIAGVLTATVTNYRSALAARDVVAGSIFERSNSHAAETHLSREREAMNEYLLDQDQSVRNEIDEHSMDFQKSIRKVGVGQPLESWFVRRAIAANDDFLATFAAGTRRAKDAQGSRALELNLDAGEDAITSPLNSLRALNVVYARNVAQSADAASRRAILFAIIAGSLATLSVLAFAVYAGRLVRSIGSRNERLRELDALKDDFVASVSHELRTPLTSIRGYLELLREGAAGKLTEGQGEFVEILERNANRLMRLVGDLLFVAQIEANEVALEPAPTDVEELVREAAEAARPAAIHEGIELDLDFEDPGIGELYADRARLGQVLDNLISNALKFTERGGHVGVRTFLQDDALVIEVSDTGMGMSKEDLGQLFQRFFRTASATEQAIQGTGLGLAIVKAIVEAHGGGISVASVPGLGTTFRVELPLARELLAA